MNLQATEMSVSRGKVVYYTAVQTNHLQVDLQLLYDSTMPWIYSTLHEKKTLCYFQPVIVMKMLDIRAATAARDTIDFL